MATASSPSTSAPAASAAAAPTTSSPAAAEITPQSVKAFVAQHDGVDTATVGALLQVHGVLGEMLALMKESMGPRRYDAPPAAAAKPASGAASPAAPASKV